MKKNKKKTNIKVSIFDLEKELNKNVEELNRKRNTLEDEISQLESKKTDLENELINENNELKNKVNVQEKRIKTLENANKNLVNENIELLQNMKNKNDLDNSNNNNRGVQEISHEKTLDNLCISICRIGQDRKKIVSILDKLDEEFNIIRDFGDVKKIEVVPKLNGKYKIIVRKKSKDEMYIYKNFEIKKVEYRKHVIMRLIKLVNKIFKPIIFKDLKYGELKNYRQQKTCKLKKIDHGFSLQQM